MPFSVLSYNILAIAYMRSHYYPNIPPEVLRRENRIPALLRHIAEQNADALCLQEVQPDIYQQLLEHFTPLGYAGVYAQKIAKPEGVATFLRAPLRLIASHVITYRDACGEEPDTGCVALVTMTEVEGRRVGIVNTHMKWDPADTPADRFRPLLETRQLLAEAPALDPDCTHWIIAGDFNVEADSSAIDAFRAAGYHDAYAGLDHLKTNNAHGHPQRVDFLLHTVSLRSQPTAIPEVTAETLLPSATQPSDHLAIKAVFDWQS
jgi:mRNA deadenylase 3'-5' endonuclease subunit Ccr4